MIYHRRIIAYLINHLPLGISLTEVVDINEEHIFTSKGKKRTITIILVLYLHHKDTSDTTTNKLTDNEWSQLKRYIIAQYLNHTGPYVPLNNELPDDNIYTQPNTLYFHNYDEKPFIKSIQDRFLDSSGEKVTYNIHWNVPENINRTTNIMNNPKYVSNNIYTGIYLIHDSLSRNYNVDIHNEMLKRKENELF
ncbi:hypothetical protein PFBG_05933 [Plasmodium falciparum 7G8]|uniref:Plasmodium falciparum erythrocyte membrane protein 1 acidic terminal segment domain-containing protein n=2 Tax=Plasmodium falciparum TaxID=5833 RepID=A0A024VQQ9_PLAFA|nr:hypothetical protein PFFCH_01778 [Plasmodium falciparum FCH/4]EUR59617.1 hypothetical protein PFBG_05933 [Plasmodium falciparum 7G8]